MKKAVRVVSTVVVLGSLLNIGTIRKKEDPILKTQTDPIAYKQKMEETKDGPKGAPMPSFNLYPKERFFSDPAVGDAKGEESSMDSSAKEKVSEVAVPQEEESEEWWGDEAPEAEEIPVKDSNPEAKEDS